jgi:hypothetical protein
VSLAFVCVCVCVCVCADMGNFCKPPTHITVKFCGDLPDGIRINLGPLPRTTKLDDVYSLVRKATGSTDFELYQIRREFYRHLVHNSRLTLGDYTGRFSGRLTVIIVIDTILSTKPVVCNGKPSERGFFWPS